MTTRNTIDSKASPRAFLNRSFKLFMSPLPAPRPCENEAPSDCAENTAKTNARRTSSS